MLHLRWACRGICACVVGLAVARISSAADPAAGPEPATPASAAGADFLPASAAPPTAAAQPPAGAPAAEAPLSGPLGRPIDPTPPAAEPTAAATADTEPFLKTAIAPPLGFAGPSGILPRDAQESSHFMPLEDRWREGFPPWDRYDQGHPPLKDYPWMEGSIFDPYNQNVLKGDYPIIGQHTFLNLTASSVSLFEGRQIPTATTPFESTQRPFEEEFFGRPNQFFYNHNISFMIDLFHGDAGFKQPDWRIVLDPVFNINDLEVDELGVINPNVLKGTSRARTYLALQQWFVEAKLADLGPDFDILSVRAGSQPYIHDFRGFLFDDINSGIRLFGNRLANRDQFNVVYFRPREKDTNSDLNTFDDREQDLVFANYYHEDFIWPGYTTQLSVAYDHDAPSFHFNKNDFLVRPDPVGVFQPHDINVAYLGWAGNGHINRFNITHQFYWALGYDTKNPLANQAQDINAQMAAIELSYDRDWVRFRTSFFWSSGDENPNNRHATGFDAPLENPNFAGGEFSFWQRQQIPLFGVNLVQRNGLIPDLRSSKTEGQVNFVNPGLYLLNFGVDMDLTPKLKMINNANLLWFDDTTSLETFLFQGNIDHYIGLDLSTGFEYRPLLSNNIIARFGVSTLIPGTGFKQLYNQFRDNVDPLFAGFLELNLNF